MFLNVHGKKCLDLFVFLTETPFPKAVGNLVMGKFNNLSHSLSEKAMAPHSSTLAWKIPRTEEPGRLQSMGSLRVGHD